MPSLDSDATRARSMSPKHKHSFSDLGRLSVPMWDSSDPERAPPPLPLNPQNPNASPTKANASENVAAAARALAERARENSGPSPYTINSMRDRSPEKSPTRTPQHKRLQSLQQGGLKDFKASLENGRGSDWHNARPSTPTTAKDPLSSSPERIQVVDSPESSDRKETPDTTPRGRGSSRSGPRPILGENTPPSATMLAIQNMPYRENEANPLGNITNSSTARSPHNGDSILSQIQNLTTIATTLQKEMAALSRRSKDNATDLVSLKEATRTRDEDIRKSLRELVSTARASEIGSLAGPRSDVSRSASAMDFVPRFLEPKPFHSPTFPKSASFSRLTPLHGLETSPDPDRAASPAQCSVEGAASIAMLEKILRDMGTKEGQERLLSTLSELLEKPRDDASVNKKLEELFDLIKANQSSTALVKHNSGSRPVENEEPADRNHIADSQLGLRSLPQSPRMEVVSEDLRQALRRMQDSVAQGGGLTGEVKSLVRELRGEVLGMGRELGRKLEMVGNPRDDMAMVVSGAHANKNEIEEIVQEGLAELKDQMSQLIETTQRQSSASARSRPSFDTSEVYALVKQSIADQTVERGNITQEQQPQFDHEAIISAVKEACEAYKPDIELQQFGLERDEILLCLKEGLDDYQSARGSSSSASREEIVQAIHDGLQHFQPPPPNIEALGIKEEVLIAVRECLEQFQPASTHEKSSPESMTKNDILSAVKEGLGNFKKEGAREIEINRDDLFLAVKAGLDNTQTPFGGYGEEVLKSLHDIVEGMRVEFKEYSAANGRDTELVLDTTKDGLEALRVEIKSYVDQGRDVTGKDEIKTILHNGLGSLQKAMDHFSNQNSRGATMSNSEFLEVIANKFEWLQETVTDQRALGDENARKYEHLLATVTAGLAELQSKQRSPRFNEPADEVLDAMKEEFEQLRETFVQVSSAQKDELLEGIQENIINSSRVSGSRSVGLDNNEDIANILREELGNIRDSWTNAAVLHNGAGESDRVSSVGAIKEALDDLVVQLSTHNKETVNESLGLIREEFERLHGMLNRTHLSETLSGEKTDLLEAIRDGLEGLRDNASRNGDESVSSEALEVVREELERIRESISSTMTRGGQNLESDVILAAIRTGFDDIQAKLGSSLGLVDRSQSEPDGLLSAVQDNLNELRSDISRMAEKPVNVDMTISYDILDTLKDGLSNLRSDIDRLKRGGRAMENGDIVLSEVDNSNGALAKNEFDKLEVMLTRLQIKVEAMDQNAQANSATRASDTVDPAVQEALTGIETMIYELRGTLDVLVARKPSSISKDDIDALETLLQNTKAKIDEAVIPSLDSAVTKEHLDAVEAVARLTSESIDSMATKIDGDIASKDDVAAVYQLLQNADSSIKTLKSQFEEDSAEKPSKADLDAIEDICDDIKEKIDRLPTSQTVPTREDLEQTTLLLERFKESHDQFKSQYESDLEITAKAFDDRRNESDKIIELIAELKSSVTESKDEIKSRLRRGNDDVRALDEILQEIEEKIDEAPNAISDVRELLETVNLEFERSHKTMENMQLGHDERSATLLDKHESLRALITDHLGGRLDDRFSELLARQDEQQHTVEQAAQVVAGKAAQQDTLLNESRVMAEDLKITIDTLGGSITDVNAALKDATDKMGDDAKTVFNKVGELSSRMDSNHLDAMGETQVVRQEISKSISSIGDLHDTIMNFQPQAMANLSNLLALVSEHYEHSKRFSGIPQDHDSKSSIEETIRSSFASLPLPRIEAAPATTVSYDDSKLFSKLDEILSLGRNDGSTLQDKLDDLIKRASATEKVFADIGKVDGMREQLHSTAAGISEFLALQTARVTQEHETTEAEAAQAAQDLARSRSDKEDLELKIENLTATRQSLASDVESLMADKDFLTSQKSRLAAEVSSLETALRIRREELQDMDARAESLERRIIEGVMDHSRALIMAKQPKGTSMNLKRVASNASNATISTATPSSVADSGVNIALSRKRSNKKSGTSSNPAARRILSLNQITRGVSNSSGASAPRAVLGGLNNVKRSQSVKNPPVRKASWAGQNAIPTFDKENESLVEENEEEIENEENYSRTGTSMTSRSASCSVSQVVPSERRTSFDTGPSEYSYMSGSYITGSDSMRTTSYGSTIRSIVGGGSSFESSTQEDDQEEREGSAQAEEEEEEKTREEAEAALYAQSEQADTVGELDYALPLAGGKDLVIRPPDGYDSGLGSDLPTAVALSQNGSDYFASAGKEIQP